MLNHNIRIRFLRLAIVFSTGMFGQIDYKEMEESLFDYCGVEREVKRHMNFIHNALTKEKGTYRCWIRKNIEIIVENY